MTLRRGRALLLLASLACAPTRVWLVRSADRSARVEVFALRNAQRVAVNGRAFPPSDAVGFERLAVSEDGRTVAWPSLRAGRWRLSVNGREGPPFEGIGDVAIAPGRPRVAYMALAAGRWSVVVDGVAQAPVEAVLEGSLRWGPGGRRLAYVARDGGRTFAVIDGARGPDATAVRALRFGDKGDLVAYIADDSGGERVVVNQRPGPLWREVPALAAADAAPRVVYVGRDREGWSLLRDEVLVERSPDAIDEPRISADGAHLAWLRVGHARVEVVRDGVVLGAHADVEGGSLALSRDGAHLLWVAVEDQRRRVFRDGVGGPSFDAITEVQATPEGRWSYVGRAGDVFTAFVDGRRVRRARAWLGGIALAPGSARWALFARIGPQLAVRSDAGAVVVGYGVADSLAFDDAGARWACLAGSPATRVVEYVFEGGARAPFAWEEIGAMLVRGDALDGVARRLVRAELARRR